MVAHHVTNGMYGLILVEPEGGLAPVDREFYVMQGELYTQQPFGQHGPQEFSLERLLAERADYLVFNGAVSTSRGSHGAAADGCTDNTGAGTIRLARGSGGPSRRRVALSGRVADHTSIGMPNGLPRSTDRNG
jgi:nitrite reductase (NO-forming)